MILHIKLNLGCIIGEWQHPNYCQIEQRSEETEFEKDFMAAGLRSDLIRSQELLCLTKICGYQNSCKKHNITLDFYLNFSYICSIALVLVCLRQTHTWIGVIKLGSLAKFVLT